MPIRLSVKDYISDCISQFLFRQANIGNEMSYLINIFSFFEIFFCFPVEKFPEGPCQKTVGERWRKKQPRKAKRIRLMFFMPR